MSNMKNNQTRGDQITKDAPRHLKDHVLTERSKPGDYARVWHVGKPGTSCFHFKITTWPGYLSIYGSIGGMTLHRTNDMISWARGAVRDPRYFFEKSTQSSHKIKEWDDGCFEEWLEYEIEQDKLRLADGHSDILLWTPERIYQARRAACCDYQRPENALYDLLVEMGVEDAGEEVDCCFDFDSNSWWSLEAVKKFLELYTEAQHHEETQVPPVH